jgi:hypothetical protein
LLIFTIKFLDVGYYREFQIHAAKLSIFPKSDKFFGRKNFTRFHKKQIEKQGIDGISIFLPAAPASPRGQDRP